MKSDYMDIEIFKFLTDNYFNNVPDCSGTPAIHYKQQLEVLVERLCDLHPTEPMFVEVYVKFTNDVGLKIDRLRQAYSCYVKREWTTDIYFCKHVLEICKQMGELVLTDEASILTFLIIEIILEIPVNRTPIISSSKQIYCYMCLTSSVFPFT